MAGEATRVAPSRARSTGSTKSAKKPPKKPRIKMPLIVVANSPDKEAALAGLERWKKKHRKIAKLIQVEDVLVDSMRGRSSTRSEEHTSELQSQSNLVCRLLLEKKRQTTTITRPSSSWAASGEAVTGAVGQRSGRGELGREL